MQVLESQFKELLSQALFNDNEAARELAKETAIKISGNFTKTRMEALMAEWSLEHIEIDWGMSGPVSRTRYDGTEANQPHPTRREQ